MSKYLQVLGAATPASPVLTSGKSSVFSTPGLALGTIGLVIGGSVAGYKMWHQHPILGMFIGGSTCGAIIPLAKGNGEERMKSVKNLLSVGAGTALSLNWERHPAWGYILGSAGAGLASLALPQSL